MNHPPRIICLVLALTVVCAAAPPGRSGSELIADLSTVDAGAESIAGGHFELRGEAADPNDGAMVGAGFTLIGGMTAARETEAENKQTHAAPDPVDDRQDQGNDNDADPGPD